MWPTFCRLELLEVLEIFSDEIFCKAGKQMLNCPLVVPEDSAYELGPVVLWAMVHLGEMAPVTKSLNYPYISSFLGLGVFFHGF